MREKGYHDSGFKLTKADAQAAAEAKINWMAF